VILVFRGGVLAARQCDGAEIGVHLKGVAKRERSIGAARGRGDGKEEDDG
jgi:hypothetical protein